MGLWRGGEGWGGGYNQSSQKSIASYRERSGFWLCPQENCGLQSCCHAGQWGSRQSTGSSWGWKRLLNPLDNRWAKLGWLIKKKYTTMHHVLLSHHNEQHLTPTCPKKPPLWLILPPPYIITSSLNPLLGGSQPNEFARCHCLLHLLLKIKIKKIKKEGIWASF